ncbi:MAG: NAD(P)H-binding protein [Gemmatimonadota bacterium]
MSRLTHPLCATRRVPIALAIAVALASCVATEQVPAPKIIVSGASGQLGGMVVEELLTRGVAPSDLILVSRTPETLERYAQMGASTRFGDFTQPESLGTAYAGGDKMLLISLNTRGNPNPRVAAERAALHQIAIDAAVAAGVQHIVYTSYVDAERNTSPIAVDHRLTEAMLRESGVAWTSLRDQWYADRIVGGAAAMIAAGRAIVDPNEVGAAYVTREDCAAAAAAVLTTPGHENRIYEITGPERILRRDIARIASDMAGVPIEVVAATPDELADVPEPPPSSETLSDHFFELTGRRGMTARQVLEANRETLLAARGR